MREFHAFSALWRAPFFNRNLFQDVALRWKGVGFRYLLLLLTLTWFIVLLKATIGFTHFINTDATTSLKDFPPITLKAGHVSSPVKQPFFAPDSRHPVFVLDTTGSITNPANVPTQALLTETSLIQLQAGGRIQTTPLAGFPDMTLDQTNLLHWLKIARNLLIPVGLPLMLLLTEAYRILCALLFAALGLAFASAFRARLSYAALLRLTAVSMTPAIFLDTLLSFVPFNFGCFAWFFFHAMTIGYLLYAVKAAAEVTREAPPAFPVLPPSAPASPFP